MSWDRPPPPFCPFSSSFYLPSFPFPPKEEHFFSNVFEHTWIDCVTYLYVLFLLYQF